MSLEKKINQAKLDEPFKPSLISKIHNSWNPKSRRNQ